MASPRTEDLPPPPRSRERERERRAHPHDDDAYQSDGRRRGPPPPPYDATEPRDGRRPRRRETYDASDEDDAFYRPRDRHRLDDDRRPAARSRRTPDDESPIPPPPIGHDRAAGVTADGHHPKSQRRDRTPSPSLAVRSPPGAVPFDEYHRQHTGDPGHSPGRAREPSSGPLPLRHRSRRERHSVEDIDPATDDPRHRRRPESGPDEFDGPPPVHAGRRHRHGSRIPNDNAFDPLPPRRRRPYDEYDDDYGRRRPPKRSSPRDDGKYRRDPHAVRYPEHDESDYDAPPRSRRNDRRRERARPRDRYDERGYLSEAPRRRDRDDHDRGYKTDGRDHRRNPSGRQRDRDRDRDGGREGADRRRHDDDRDRDDKRRGKKGDLNQMLENGQKTWNKVEPIAKPMITALAKKYLDGPGAH